MNTQVLTRPAGILKPPSFFNPDNAANWAYTPSHARIFDEADQWRSSGRVKTAALDQKKVHFLGIDLQRDFCNKEGTLYVAGRSGTGAIDDSKRIAEWLYANMSIITKITCTLDTHIPYQIFFRSFWLNEDGTPVKAFTTITADDLARGKYRLNPITVSVVGGNYAWLTDFAMYYCKELERKNKYKLYIWPEHCLLGSIGHTLVGLIEEAVLFHSYARGVQGDFQIKGAKELTENYSVLSPEVLITQDGRSIGQKNVKFIEVLLEADYVIIAGQAASHCVASSIDDLLTEILAKDPALAQKVYVVEDMMSAVTVPNPQGGFYEDFTSNAEGALKRFLDNGMHVVRSTTPVDQWPDFKL